MLSSAVVLREISLYSSFIMLEEKASRKYNEVVGIETHLQEVCHGRLGLT